LLFGKNKVTSSQNKQWSTRLCRVRFNQGCNRTLLR